MPTLNWASKAPPEPVRAALHLDSVIYPQGAGYPDEEPGSQLILGDNLAVMSALLPEYKGRLNLIYADPPFFTNRRYPTRIGRGEDSRRPQDWKLAEGYPDAWEDIDAYLDMLYPRLSLMYRLLAADGTLYLHLDWHADHYARLLLDEIFGPDRLINEIIWVYHGPSPIRRAFNRKHDTLLAYSKNAAYTFNVDAVREPYHPNTVKTFAASPKAGFGKVPDLARGKVPEDWWYFPVVARLHSERSGYPTQKPLALLERIILASSNPGDLVGDFFCGAGTTPLAAGRLGRRYIANDLTWRAVQITRRRLVESGLPPFNLYYETGAQQNRETTPLANERGEVSLAGGAACLAGEWLDELEYWEIDPNWDGTCFRSARQAVRPRAKAAISARQVLPGGRVGERICARFDCTDGRRLEWSGRRE
jgi:DNA modification methylase